MIRAIAQSCLVVLVLTVQAHACRCRPPAPPKEALEASLGVFAGKVTAVKEDGQHRLVTLSVSQSWKGAPANEVTIRTASSSAACGYNFKKDGEYLIYASGEKEGVWATHTCTRTRSLADAKEDIEALGPGKVVE